MKKTITIITILLSSFSFSQTETSKSIEHTQPNYNDDDIAILAFPNPSQGIIQFNKQVRSLNVMSLDGQRMTYRKNVSRIDLRYLKKGTYILEINETKTIVIYLVP